MTKKVEKELQHAREVLDKAQMAVHLATPETIESAKEAEAAAQKHYDKVYKTFNKG